MLSNRAGFWLAAALILLAAFLRTWQVTTLPPGLHQEEITDIRITETARLGLIEVFYDLGGQGREGLYHAMLAAATSFIGSGLVGYHIISVWISLLVLALVYALVTRLYSPLAGVAAVGLLAVNLCSILLAREVGRETLLPLLVTAVMLALARSLAVYQPGRPSTAPFAALGVLLGAGFYIHPTHFMIALFSMAFIAYMVLARHPLSRRTLSYLNFGVLVMIIIATPYLISSIRLPTLGGAARLLGDYRVAENPPLQAITDSVMGIFFMGDSNPLYNVPGRPLIDLVSGLLLLVGVLTALRQWRQPRYALPLIATLILLPVAFLTVNSPNFLAAVGLLPLLALFFGLGVTGIYRSVRTQARPVIWLGLAALLLFNLVWVTRDLYQTWPGLEAVYDRYNGRLGQLAHYLDQTTPDIPTLICESRPLTINPLENLSSTDILLLMMNRKNAPLRFADCGTGLVLANGGTGQQIVFPGADQVGRTHQYLQTWMARGQVLSRPDLPPDSVLMLNVERELADTIGRFTTTAPVGYAPEAPGDQNLASPPIRLEENLTFLGYEKESAEPYSPGGIVTSITYWRIDGTLPPDLRLFTHILLDPATIAAQNDTISVDVSRLRNRDVFIQVMFIPLPPYIRDGEYQISVGAYRDTSDTRVGVLQNDQPRGTRLFLGQINVRRAAG